jgi:tripeptidyl-peptidase-1
MAPSAQTVKAVTDYFASEGVSAQPLAGHGDWIGFDTTVAQAGRLFNASFSTYHHVDTGTQHIRTMAYSVPAHLKEHIELVHPMTTYVDVDQRHMLFCSRGCRFSAKASRGAVFGVPDPVPRRSSPRQAQKCGDLVTPACLQELYGIPSDPATQSGNSMVVTGYSQDPQDADTKVQLRV